MTAKHCECKFPFVGKPISHQDYQELFNPIEYLKFLEASFPSQAWPRHFLQCHHESFQMVPEGVKVLDFGAGPVILSTISAATKASEIVLADFSDANLAALRQWLHGDSQAFDWLPYFRYVVQELEGKGEQETKERQDLVRNVVKDVVHCDINNDPPLDGGYNQMYDVVVCSLVLEGASNSRQEYRSNASHLAKLVKPGGSLFLYSVENKNGFYSFGNRRLPNIHICNECWLSAFTDAGFAKTVIKTAPTTDPNRQYRFLHCRRI